MTDHEDGPVAYLIPGNHDWYDGLSCFVRSMYCTANGWEDGNYRKKVLFCA